jgi:predicted negative regulator of RcsB-dependent stress response
MAQPDPRTPRRTPEADDPFTERMLVASEWARRNATVLIVSIVAVVVVVGGFLYYRSHQADRHERASAEFMQLQAAVDAGQAEAVRSELERFVNVYDGTDYALEGRVVLAEVYLHEGNPQAAIQMLDGYTRRVGRSPLRARAAMLAGTAHQALEEDDRAIELYRRVGSDAEFGFHRRDALLAAGALLEERGDHAGAADVYRQALADVAEDSPERPRFEMRLAEAEARAQHNG